MKILAFTGSPRKKSNSSLLLRELLAGAQQAGGEIEVVSTADLDLKPCTGCLTCNILKRCRLKGDCWDDLSAKILAADSLVFATPVYFHHLPGPLKMLVDRFRSYINVSITEDGLDHAAWHHWEKHFILLLSMGSSSDTEAKPIVDLFEFITRELGEGNRLRVIAGTRLAVAGQVAMTQDELEALYPKMNLPATMAAHDFEWNRALLTACRSLGRELAEGAGR